jgi:DNA-damage-inducible protein D
MIEIGKGGQRPVKTVLLSRYACYLIIQNAAPKKVIVAQGQTYFAIQTRRQELANERLEDEFIFQKFEFNVNPPTISPRWLIALFR